MKKKRTETTIEALREMFRSRLPYIYELALRSPDAVAFKRHLLGLLPAEEEVPLSPAQANVKRLILHDGQTLREASREEELTLTTFSGLWHFLTQEEPVAGGLQADALLDVYKQLEALQAPPPARPEPRQVARWMKRWPSGLEPQVAAVREGNRARIVARLVERIDTHLSGKNRYVFPPGLDYAAKVEMVQAWWGDYRFHLALAARSLKELNRLMGCTLPPGMRALYKEAHRKGIPVFVTPYYLSLMDITGQGYDDSALRSYVFYSRELVDTFGHIKAWEREDQVEAGRPNAAGWLLPEGHNIHRRYPEVAILIPDTVGRACGGLCASCQRLYDFQSGRFSFDLESLRPKETWEHKLKRLMRYFREDTQLRDILITGGDALMSRTQSLKRILDAVYTMAKQKREDNRQRAVGSHFAELERVRLGTRLPVYLPMRISEELVDVLAAFKAKAQTVGVKQFFIQTHFQTPLEITPEVCEGIRRLQGAGWTVTNQLVYNVAASRRGHTAKLRQDLNRLGVLCYYTFSVKGFGENRAVFTPNSRSVQEQQEEKALGQLSEEAVGDLMQWLDGGESHSHAVARLQCKHGLPFLATDRSVMNLPGIGKSMSFQLVGILPDGCRLLAFTHDHTRHHSPLIEHLPVVYIRENKSIAAYLRQLETLGECPADYASIWHYTESDTEPRFPLYDYPTPASHFTAEYANLGDLPQGEV